MTRTTSTLFAFVVALLAVSGAACAEEPIQTISAEALRQRLTAEGTKPLIVDVREPAEFDAGHIEEATLVPLATTDQALTDVAKDREIVLVCRSGRRSAKAYAILAARGFTSLKNMEGGMIAWERLGYPVARK